jgi:lysophospholipase L1-like esterase
MNSPFRLALPALVLVLTAGPVDAACRRAALPDARPDAAIEDDGGRALAPFYDALTSLDGSERRLVRVLHYGDSHVAADLMTAALRSALQARFGDGGAGLVFAVKPWHWYARRGIESGATDGWRVEGGEAQPLPGGRHGIAGLSFTAERAGELAWVTGPFARAEVLLLSQRGGGTVDIALDGARLATRSLRADTGGGGLVTVAATPKRPGRHTVSVLATAPGSVRLFGVALDNECGVQYEALGINGARASRPLTWDRDLFAEALAARPPDLVVLAYGTNEVTDPDFDPTTYERTWLALLRMIREVVPRAAVLVVSPPDRAEQVGVAWRTVPDLPALVEAQRRACRASGAAFFDLYGAMGGAGSIERWRTGDEPLARPDRVHLTTAGYHRAAAMLYGALMREYESRRAARKER